MVRFFTAFLVGAAIMIGGVAVLEALEVGGIAWLGLLLLAMVGASVVDREHFYGSSEDDHATHPHV